MKDKLIEVDQFANNLEVIRQTFRQGDPGALSMADALRKRHLEAAAALEKDVFFFMRSSHKRKAADHHARADKIQKVIDEERRSYTPRDAVKADNLPSPHAVVKSRKRQHDPIAVLFARRRLTHDQRRAAYMINRVYEEVTRPSQIRERNLEASLGRPPRNSGAKPGDPMSHEIATEHLLVYRPWAEAVGSSRVTSLPMVIDIVVDCCPLREVGRRYHLDHEQVVVRLKIALDLYNDIKDEAQASRNWYLLPSLDIEKT